jgi:uncharacterized protein
MTAPVPSPCTSVCRIDAASGWCEGCLRTLDEVAAWSVLDDAAKRAVWLELGRRRVLWRRQRSEPGTTPQSAP